MILVLLIFKKLHPVKEHILGKSLAKEEQEEVITNGLKTILQWEIAPHRLVTKYASILHAVREIEIG